MTVKRQGFAPVGHDQSVSGKGPAANIEPLDVSQFKPRPSRNPDAASQDPASSVGAVGQGRDTALPSARDVALAASKAGFTSRTGVKVDGRSLRRTGRDAQLNAKVEPDVKDAIVLEAARRDIAVGQLIKEMFEVYRSVAQEEGGS
ncbi:MAG TPA: hypothetical protein DD390_00865 [Rhodospirillaceae bacterium]|nr:hypothetical protein [Rhodospirillaceae bacterium]MAX61876.1 hypothetical protein [Rhodospirillaceae bacterium]HBM11224.1 hypothetical protein [Rhodospirillaceae bacterium]|tara:strand:- start:100091 stop:100528 length:438 start_codon:yes stop_codon:yes gene_type:complete